MVSACCVFPLCAIAPQNAAEGFRMPVAGICSGGDALQHYDPAELGSVLGACSTSSLRSLYFGIKQIAETIMWMVFSAFFFFFHRKAKINSGEIC